MIKTYSEMQDLKKCVPPFLFYQELEEEVCSTKIRE